MSQTFEWRSQSRLLDEVAQALRERIYAGVYAPGATLRQERIAAEFGISRTPLREALRVLERDGLVVNKPGSGVRVATADLPKLLDAYAVREAMDGVAARNAAERATASEIKALAKQIDQQQKVVERWDPGAYTQSNVVFHEAIVSASRNASLASLGPLLRMTSQVFAPAFSLSSERASTAVAEHRLIVEAIAARDPDQAEKLARAHIHATAMRLKTLLPQGETDNEA
ncbi:MULTISPECIES: GntR family transcriptional regulator [Ensifer]|jgi:DNA-binding GntR family transcriptional regulator|uniref:FCD domain-containing protein n=1 Tax=Ensifer canadensis TaxID=555315 RepID=A0AAW4FEX5_9HYPH|nr:MULTISPECIES: GntR family transcriptional regulator [Ensifer]AHK46686.1 putative GntR, transcriptional regulator GntR [Ensifer adhaerens OV14]MDP9629502.1 DNA-binding GntR family transcriptional regulator [Ensifer adhaerens]KQU90817.1 GntR family transcriptional regulator [Ensifer sp. Root31]KQW50144.1 GntR family transcriptional regulator [Ensifer sp. Root1252]KQW67566.1 GntR family transcriptional regulator [Ensifer sp. Root127]